MPDITVNGTAYDHNSIEVKIAVMGERPGIKYPMIKSISFKGKREPGKARGTGPYLRQITLGTYDADGDLEMYEGSPDDPEEAGAIQLRATGGQKWMRKKWIITITRGGDGLPVTVDELSRVTLTGNDSASSEGSEAAMTKFGMLIQDPIKNNGIIQM